MSHPQAAAVNPPELNLNNPDHQEVAVQLLQDAYTEVVNDLQAFHEENEALRVMNTNLRFHNSWLKNGILAAALVLIAMTIGYIVGMGRNWT